MSTFGWFWTDENEQYCFQNAQKSIKAKMGPKTTPFLMFQHPSGCKRLVLTNEDYENCLQKVLKQGWISGEYKCVKIQVGAA